MQDDHCTLWLEGTWAHCCQAHDAAYAEGVDRGLADLALETCVAATGNPIMALLMLLGVTAFGWIAWGIHKAKRWWRTRT